MNQALCLHVSSRGYYYFGHNQQTEPAGIYLAESSPRLFPD